MKYLLYINIFLMPIRRIIDFIEQFQNGMSGFRRYVEILEIEPEKESPHAEEVSGVEGSISFQDVTFTYGEGKDILSNITLDIRKGQTVAFVGPSGSGKTTLCHLIPRFYEISSGRIAIDGRDIRDFTYESLRRNVGIVQQDVFLFTGTIWDNIAYGNFDATSDQIVQAAKLI